MPIRRQSYSEFIRILNGDSTLVLGLFREGDRWRGSVLLIRGTKQIWHQCPLSRGSRDEACDDAGAQAESLFGRL